MVYWAFFEAVQLVNSTILRNEGNEVRITFRFDTWNSFVNSLLVLVEDFFAIFENFSPSFRIFIEGFLTELVQEWTRNNNIGVPLLGVDDNVEESNCSTGIYCFLLHVENIVGNLFGLKVAIFSCFESILGWSLLIKHQNSQYRFWNHLKTPLFGWQ